MKVKCTECKKQDCNPFTCEEYIQALSEGIANSMVVCCANCEYGAVSDKGKGFCFLDYNNIKTVSATYHCGKGVERKPIKRKKVKRKVHTTKGNILNE